MLEMLGKENDGAVAATRAENRRRTCKNGTQKKQMIFLITVQGF